MAGADPAVLQNLKKSEQWTTATDTDSEEITPFLKYTVPC